MRLHSFRLPFHPLHPFWSRMCNRHHSPSRLPRSTSSSSTPSTATRKLTSRPTCSSSRSLRTFIRVLADWLINSSTRSTRNSGITPTLRCRLCKQALWSRSTRILSSTIKTLCSTEKNRNRTRSNQTCIQHVLAIQSTRNRSKGDNTRSICLARKERRGLATAIRAR